MPLTIAFDVYGTLIDTAGVVTALEGPAGGRAAEVARLWRDKQLEYSFRRGLMRLYGDGFAQCTREALDYACLVHGVDLLPEERVRLLDGYRRLPAFQDAAPALGRMAAAVWSSKMMGRKANVLLQINASEEKSKSGVAVGAAVHLAEQIDSMPNLQLLGLMTMAPLTGDLDAARFVFGRTREIFEEMRWHKIGGGKLRHLSMGMSNDYEDAILEGATLIRVGTALFGGKAEGDHDTDDTPDLDAQLRKGGKS